MSVSALDKNGDWTFGRGRSNYLRSSAEIAQNVITRIKSFKDDWFLSIDENIDWFTILGNRNNKETIRNEVSRVVLATEGVKTLDRLELIDAGSRNLTIFLEYTDIFDEKFSKELGLTNGI